MPRYLVGIDLGTTNSALSFVDTSIKGRARSRPTTFPIPQLVAPAQVAPQPLLPSFLYLPGEHDLPEGSWNLPWNPQATEIIGQFARSHGAKIPGRQVSSAKSWLCHPGVDRTAPLLPWTAPPEVQRLSPLAVSARYLKHMVDAWNAAPGRTAEDRLEETPVVLTVPASFDDVARNLTAEAAKLAGLKKVTLLEEPQAAFYCWLGMHDPAEEGLLQPGMRCVVVDVGGGTTDFSLIRVGEEQGELTFLREAVGDHLLLGGDNMDLALARNAESKLSAKLEPAQFMALIQASRQAKEILLAQDAPPSHPVTVVGRGRSVIAGTLSATMTREDVRQVLFDGFFPDVPYESLPQRSGRAGLQEMGLPYVNDPAVTRHLAHFLNSQLPPGEAPDAILFNGGVFQPEILRTRLINVMKSWYERPGKPWTPVVLTTPSLDLAVAWGAAYSAWLKQSGGRRIGGGAAKSYYLGIEVPGTPAETGKQAVVCVIPRGMADGDEVAIPEPEFQLALGQPVLFPLFTSSVRSADQPGQVLTLDPGQLLQLPPLHTVLRGGKRSGNKFVPVTLLARSTELGTIELYCVSREGNRWLLEFNVRDTLKDNRASDEARSGSSASVNVVDVFPEERVQSAGKLIQGSYQANQPTPQELTKLLETDLELGRTDWPTGLCRRLWDYLTEAAANRNRSPAHLSRWYNLTGFVLRPGYGDPVDRYRVEALWKLITATASGSVSGGNKLIVPEGGADYWIMWRRVSGGLNGALQQALFARLKPVLLPAKNKAIPRTTVNELAEMWRAAASLERLDTRTKELLGDMLVSQIHPSGCPAYLFWSLTRLGARVLLYGPLNAIVHPAIIQRWLRPLLAYTPTNENDRLGWQFCLAQLARRNGVLGVDIDEELREKVLNQLTDCPLAWQEMVRTVVTDDHGEQSRMFGDSLPIGLKLSHAGG